MNPTPQPTSLAKVAEAACCFAKAAHPYNRAPMRAATLPAEVPLQQLRQALGLTQQALAEMMNVKQPVVSKLERQSNMRILTLRGLIEAMGGKLEVVARFPQGDVRISNY